MDSWKEKVLQLVQFSGVVTLLGYVALRAHWNHLGVVTLPGVGVDRYLMESYGIAGHVLVPGVCAWAICVLIGRAFARLIALVKRSTKGDVFVRRCETHLIHLLPLALAILLIGGIFRALQIVSVNGRDQCEAGVLVGAIAPRVGAGCYPEESLAFVVLLGALCVVTLVARQRAIVAARRTGALWRATELLAIVVVLQLPLVYGYAARPTTYAAATVETTTDGRVDGFVILQTEQATELWTMAHGVGVMRVIPLAQTKSIAIREARDLYAIAVQRAKEP